MAGAGYKLFATGDVLTAAQVNTYLQEQVVMVFANAAARTTALSGVLAEGMVTYLKDTDALEIYSGTAWVGFGSGDITGITTGATSGLTGGVTSGTADLKLNTTAKGGLLVGTGSGTVTELTVGSNNTILTADSSTASGLKWAAASSTPTFVGVSAARSSSFTVSSATATAISLNSADEWDTDSIHDPSVNPTRFTIPSGKGGKWSANIGLLVAGQSSSGTIRLLIYKNGTTWLRRFTGTVTASVGESEFAYSEVINVSAGDYIEFYVWQNVWSSITCYCGTGAGGEKQGTAQLTYLGA